MISVHNRLTLADAAYLLKALMETSLRGDAAVVLIHVDKRVGVASEDRDDAFENKQEEGDEKKKKKYLYFHSPLKRYVDACLSSFSNVTDGEGPAKPWGPYLLGVYDLGAIRDSGALFVRKVSAAVDENLIRLLPVERSEEDRTLVRMALISLVDGCVVGVPRVYLGR